MIAVTCEKCGKTFSVPDDEGWKTVCKDCYKSGYRPEKKSAGGGGIGYTPKVSNQQILDVLEEVKHLLEANDIRFNQMEERFDKMSEVYKELTKKKNGRNN